MGVSTAVAIKQTESMGRTSNKAVIKWLLQKRKQSRKN